MRGTNATDGERIRRLAERFCVPRRAGSEADPRIRALLGDELASSGYRVEEQPFRFTLSVALGRLRAGLLLLAAGVGLMGWTGYEPDWWKLGGCLVAFAAGFLLTRSSVFDDRCLLDGETDVETANILARHPDAQGEPRFVVMAHHDSKSQNISFLYRGFLVTLGLLGLAVATPIAATSLAGIEAGSLRLLSALFGTAGMLGLANLARIDFSDRSPGGLDNGASVAVVLDVARRVAGQPGVEDVLFVIPGAEEDLMCGARTLARAKGAEWKARDVEIINLDGVGAKGPVGVVANAAIAAQTKRLGQDAGFDMRRIRLPPGTGTDAMPFERMGFRTQTLTTGALSHAVLAIHTPGDVVENLDDEALARAAAVLEGMILERIERSDPA